jgi:hypothetical protein
MRRRNKQRRRQRAVRRRRFCHRVGTSTPNSTTALLFTLSQVIVGQLDALIAFVRSESPAGDLASVTTTIRTQQVSSLT